MSEVVKRLERWYGVQIEVENKELLAYRFTATFKSESLDRVLNVLKISSDIDYQINDTLVRLKSVSYTHLDVYKRQTATNPNYDCLPEYTELGWVPFDKEKESVSKSLEYAYDDYCIAQVAQKLGKTEDYEFFMKRALSYKNLIDPGTKYMRGRDSKGNWRTPFAPIAYQGPGSVNGLSLIHI